MLFKDIKTSNDLNPLEIESIDIILSEVKVNGFYSNYCANLIRGIDNNDTLISEIQLMASKALLRVTFNADKTICIFED